MTTHAVTRSMPRVLFAVREDLTRRPGGDSAQVLSSAQALRQRGVHVTVDGNGTADPSRFDLVHLWHLERVHETYHHFRRARRANRPVALTPIYWPRQVMSRAQSQERQLHRRSWGEDARNIVRWLRARSMFERRAVTRALAIGWERARKELLHSASVILPNSQAEADQIAQETSQTLRFHIVPNAIDVPLCRHILEHEAPQERNGVLCVGSFDPRKNQLRLIRALRDTDVDVVFIGEPRRNHWWYYCRCRRAAGPRMTFLGAQPLVDTLRWMRRARVHASPSHYETPGLANLEAAAMGCTLATGDCPPVREYFQQDAVYLASDDTDRIRAGILEALTRPPSDTLAERIFQHFTWSAAAKATVEAYAKALA